MRSFVAALANEIPRQMEGAVQTRMVRGMGMMDRKIGVSARAVSGMLPILDHGLAEEAKA
jgi:hypothetical protein